MAVPETNNQSLWTAGKSKDRRKSIFTETGLEGHDNIVDEKLRGDRPLLKLRFRSNVSIIEPRTGVSHPPTPISPAAATTTSKPSVLSRIPLFQMALLVAMLGIVLPTLNGASSSQMMAAMAEAGVVKAKMPDIATLPQKRQDAQTNVCKRWSGQSAVVNGTMFYYGGRVATSADQTTNEWNNDLVSLDLTSTWQIGSPSLTGLPIPSGPPSVSLGYLWSSTDNLYLYGGEFSDSPVETPSPFALWSYNVAGQSWAEHQSPEFQDGTPVQRAAEGAGISVPSLGRGFYFGGHLDYLTTNGWPISVARVYLPSMLEYTMPGFSNAELQSSSPTGSDGAYRNITAGSSGFPERADGVLVYVPGYSTDGIIVGLAGGTNSTFTQLNVIDVYDIASSTWYKQATTGAYPDVRVNPCTVAASAADGSSTQIYMYGGQNLQPYGDQEQYSDIWILSLPSFAWIKVDQDGQSTPPARAGHMCEIWNSQMVVWGGYVGTELSCDSPGIYVFNTSSLVWQNQYTALQDSDNLNRQKSQRNDPNALQGSYGYLVPEAVQKVVGGNALGGATLTAPAQSATGGPLATGKPATYTVTGSDGSVTTSTSTPNGDGSNNTHSGSSLNVGAIVAGVVAGVLFLVVLYLAFCTYIYRKQMKQYKEHAAMLQHDSLQQDSLRDDASRYTPGPAIFASRKKESEKSGSSHGVRDSTDNRSQRSGGQNVGQQGDGIMQHYPYDSVMALKQSATAHSSTDDLLKGQEPSFLGVLLSPRRSLRVVNN